jgi:hypothetical protein
VDARSAEDAQGPVAGVTGSQNVHG